jgi:hypothetical protein
MIDLEKMQLASAWIESHAKPGDNWQVLVDRDRVYLTTSAEDDVRRHEFSLAEFKSILIAVYSSTIDRVGVTIPIDAQQYGGTDLLVWLTSMDWGKFHVASSSVKEGTSELVAAFRLADSGAV